MRSDDLDLRALVSVEPSPDFAARVRARVAEDAERSPRGWLFGWQALGAAAVVASAAVLTVYLGRPVDPRPSHAEVVLEARSVSVLAPLTGAVPSQPPPRAAVVVAAPPRRAEEALLDRAEVRALQHLFTSPPLVIDASAADANESAELAPLVIPELSIAPLTIDPVEGDPDGR